jgi:CBS domain-containing protein
VSDSIQLPQLSADERQFYRDLLRAARYAALADSEGFDEICFAVESLGMRLLGKQAALGKGTPRNEGYEPRILKLALTISWRDALAKEYAGCFTRFEALYESLRSARNDAMHTGAYARHATSAAIELCIHMEEAVMGNEAFKSKKVADYMVRQVVTVESWHPVAYARQLMLTHSFSFLPVRVEKRWKLLSEMSIARFLRESRAKRLAMSITEAAGIEPRFLEEADQIRPDSIVADLYESSFANGARLWLVTERDTSDNSDRLLGVLSPFELM